MSTQSFPRLLCQRLERDNPLDPEERASIEALPFRLVEVPANHAIVREGDKPSHSVMIMRGVASTSRNLSNGKRQIMAYHIREDMPDLLSLNLDVMDSDLTAVSNCLVAFVEHSHLRKLCHAHPRLADALWRITLIDAAIFREWVVNVGCRRADQRVGHLLMEFLTRMAVVGVGEPDECTFPMTQSNLAEATGMSSVHINRSLQSLREVGLIKLAGKNLRVPDRQALAEFADFSTTYLHLPRRSREVKELERQL